MIIYLDYRELSILFNHKMFWFIDNVPKNWFKLEKWTYVAIQGNLTGSLYIFYSD